MAVKLTLRKADLEILATVDGLWEGGGIGCPLSGQQLKAWAKLYERVLAAELKPKKEKGEGLAVRKAVDIAKSVLGKRLVMPAGFPALPSAWFITNQRKLSLSGVTEAMFTQACQAADGLWAKGSVKFESVVRQVDVLLSDYTETAPQDKLRPAADDLGDEEL